MEKTPSTRLKEEKQQARKLPYFQTKDLNLECIDKSYKSIQRPKNTNNKIIKRYQWQFTERKFNDHKKNASKRP